MYPLTRENLTGPWAGLPVAWDDDDEFDESTYRADVARCAAHGVPGVYTAGTTGEFYALSEDEFRAVTRAAVEEAHAHAMPAMIGCTATSTRGALARIGCALRSGADAVQVALPFWMPLADHEIVPFFTGLAQAAGPMALSLYETERSKRTLTVDQHRRIRDRADNYLMVKANSGTVGAAPQGCRALSEFVNVFAGEHLWAELAPAGAIGCCSSAVYANPDVALALFRDLTTGNLAGLAAGAARLRALYDFLFGEFAGRGFQDSAWDRLVGNATGFLQAGTRCRAPYSSPDHRDVQRVRDWISRNAPELLWAGR